MYAARFDEATKGQAKTIEDGLHAAFNGVPGKEIIPKPAAGLGPVVAWLRRQRPNADDLLAPIDETPEWAA